MSRASKRTGRKSGRTRTPRTPQPEELERQIVQVIPADPGWHALYAEKDGPAMMPLVCFALIEFRVRDEAPMRFVCPMVVHDDGVIDDAQLRDGFVDLIPPCMHAPARADGEVCVHEVDLDSGKLDEVRS